MWNQSWPSLELFNLERGLASLKKLVNTQARNVGAEELAGELARYFVVRICGSLEQSVEHCCRAYLSSKSSPRAADFGSSWLGKGKSPTPANLIALVGRFDEAWKEDLSDLLNKDDELLHRELHYLVDRRNKIAHGLSEGVGVVKANVLHGHAQHVIDWFVRTLDPRRA